MADLLDTSKILTVEELATALKVSRVFIYKLVGEGKIPFFRVEKCVRFSRAEIEAWLEARRGQGWHRDKKKAGLN